MYEKLQKYKCGACGNENYHIYQEEGNKQRIITECTKCKSQTEITVKSPEIDLKWGENSEGMMSIY